MQRLTQFVKNVISGNSLGPMFKDEECILEEAYYEAAFQLLTTSGKQKNQKFVSKQKIGTLASLRLLFLHYYSLRKHGNSPSFIRKISFKPVTVNSKLRERHHALETNIIDSLKEYFTKIEDLGPVVGSSLVEGINRCNYILEIMEVAGKLEFNFAHRVNRPDEAVFTLLNKYLLLDTKEYLKELCEFVHKYSGLILQDHGQSLSINHIYERAIFYHRQAQNLLKFVKDKIQLPSLGFDDQNNRKIELRIREFKLAHSEKTVSATTLHPSNISFYNINAEESGVKLNLPA